MNLFTPDLFRNFALGFVAAAALMGLSNFGEWSHALEAPANAAQPLEAPAPSGEFLIAPWEIEQ